MNKVFIKGLVIKAFGKKDLTKLVKKHIVDKNGRRQTVWVRTSKLILKKHNRLTGNIEGIYGDASHIVGDASKINGNVSRITGNVSNISGNVSYITDRKSVV